VALITDISDREAAEERAIRSATLAVAGTLAAGVAHEFNNINGIIKGNLDLVRFSGVKLPPVVEEKLDVIRDMVNRSKDITNNMLMFTRENKNGVKPTSLKQIVDGSLRLIERDFRTDGVRVYRGDMVDVIVKVNSAQIAQVLMNLFINAKHAMQESPVRNLFVDMEEDNNTVSIIVTDTGCGIPERDVAKLFTPFFTTKGEHAPEGSKLAGVRGTGLGLSVAHTIMKRHGGEIAVKSVVGSGSTFTLTLPVCSEQPAYSSLVTSDVERGNGERVLVLDDEEELVRVLGPALSLMGYDCYATTQGKQALQEHTRKPFDVVLVDLLMPVMSGAAFFKELGKLEGSPKKIVVTGNMKDNWPSEELKVDKIVMKPFEIEDILSAIRECIDGEGQ
jgi:nitrogen-specific signal transduction histidine kinase